MHPPVSAPSHLRSPSARKQAGGGKGGGTPSHSRGPGLCPFARKRGRKVQKGGALPGLHVNQRAAPPPGLRAAPGSLAPSYTREGAPLPAPPFVCRPWGIVTRGPTFASCLMNEGGRGDKKGRGRTFPPAPLCANGGCPFLCASPFVCPVRA